MAMRMLISCPVLLQPLALWHCGTVPDYFCYPATNRKYTHYTRNWTFSSATYPGTVACKRPFTSSFGYHLVCLKKAVPDIYFQVGKLLQPQRDQSSFSYCSSRDKLSCRTSQVRCWINTARSAISTILVISDCATSDTHPLVKDISLKKNLHLKLLCHGLC